MKIRKLLIAVLLCVMFSMTAFGTTAFAAEGDPPDPNAFTPGGSGTVIDNVMEQNGKEFYTIKTEDGNIFYLVVDRMRETDNVYFLNAVTEKDLMALAEKAGKPITPGAESSENPNGDPEQKQPEQEKQKPENKGFDTNTLIFVGIAVAAVGVIGFYFKIVKGKKNKKADDDFDEYEDDDSDNSDDPDDEPEDE